MDWDQEKLEWLKIKEGETQEFTVESIDKRQADDCIKGLPKRDYYYEFTTDQGKLTVNNLGLFVALQNVKIKAWDRVRVHYVKKGMIGIPSTFEVTVISRGDEQVLV